MSMLPFGPLIVVMATREALTRLATTQGDWSRAARSSRIMLRFVCIRDVIARIQMMGVRLGLLIEVERAVEEWESFEISRGSAW